MQQPSSSPSRSDGGSWQNHTDNSNNYSRRSRPQHHRRRSSPSFSSSAPTSPSSSWSPRNLSSFLSLRDEFRSALLECRHDESFVRSRSTSAIPKEKEVNYFRARSAAYGAMATAPIGQDETWRRRLQRHLLPVNDDYFNVAAWALLDTPLPLVLDDVVGRDDGPRMIRLRRPRVDELCHLLPRIYLREFFDWARRSLVNSSVEQFVNSSSNRPCLDFVLDDDTLATLVALSIMTDQYFIWKEGEWTRFFNSLEKDWKAFLERRMRSTQDEKKNDDDATTGVYESNFLEECAPGAMDCRFLSTFGHPLQLRRNVALLMKGVDAITANAKEDCGILSIDEEMKEEAIGKFLDLDVDHANNKTNTDDRPRMGVCPVSASFHEHLRSTLGVICEDGTSISFSSNKLKSGGSSTSLLHHEQYANVAVANITKNVDIPHPSAHHPSITAGASNSQLLSVARPIEFPRRIVSTVIRKNEGSTPTSAASSPKKMSSYNKLMKEAMTSRNEEGLASSQPEEKSCAVEVHPVEFRYVVVDPTLTAHTPTSPNKQSDPTKSTYSASGLALVSRASRLSDAFTDLKRAVEHNRSISCVRLWMKSPCLSTSNSRGATIKGDGYDLIDDSDSEDVTVEKWLRLEDESNDHPAVVEMLVEIRSSPTSKWVRESLEFENRLQVGDFVDAQDTALKWYEAIVKELTPETVKVHYFGWGSRWDGELPRRKGVGNKKVSPPMPLWTKTSRWRERVKVNSEVEVRQTASLVHRPKWYKAVVMAVSDNPKEITGGAELELIDEDASGKKIPLKLLRRKRQVLLKVHQERNNCATPAPAKIMYENGMPVVHPPFIRWVDLYGEEICEVNTHINWQKQTDAPVTATYAMDSQRKQPVEVLKSFNNLHGAGFVRESLRGMPPAPGSVGLHNLGNSCYMNSILQCIQHIDPLTQYFLKGDYQKDVNKNNPLGSGGRVASAYASFLSEIWTGEYSILAPRLLKQTVGFFAPQFNNNYQHDSQEFCQYLMDGLHEDLNRVTEKPYVEHIEAFGMKDEEAAVESWKGHLRRHDSIFVDYTQGMHRSHLTCPSCGKESIKYDVYSSISLPLVPSKDRPRIPLKECLDQFTGGEQLDEHNAWYCSRCKKHVCALKLITLWNTPDILILHLKRFTFEKCPTHDGRLLKKKIEDKVEFPIDRLDLSDYVLGPKHADAPPVYKLFGVSEHTGSTANSGHYTATVRNSKDGNWYRYNDSHVGSTSGDAAVTGGAYLLFYQRERGSLRWAGMERQMNGGKDEDGFTEVQNKRKKK